MTTSDGRYGTYGSSLRDLPRLRSHRRMRESSWDRTGGNEDRVTVRPGQTITLADIRGAGSVNHIWMTVAPRQVPTPDSLDNDYLRKLVLKIYCWCLWVTFSASGMHVRSTSPLCRCK